MPPVGAAIAAIGSAIGGAIAAVSAFAAGSFLGSILVNTAVSLGLSLIARALAPKPKIEQRGGTAMAAIIGHNGPEEAALGAFQARFQHWRASFIHEDTVGATQMGTHVVDDRHKVGPGPPDPVAERAAVQIDPLPLEDLGLPIKRQVVTKQRRLRESEQPG